MSGTDCKEYIIQNNNWGNPTGSTQIVNYTGSSFTVQSSSGSGSSAPASFPSTYIGANGNIANGTYNTWADSGLPKQISAMQSVMTNFAWSGGSSGGDFNATYDVWFAKSPPTAGSYNDGISGFLMVWLYKPGSRQPTENRHHRRPHLERVGRAPWQYVHRYGPCFAAGHFLRCAGLAGLQSLVQPQGFHQ